MVIELIIFLMALLNWTMVLENIENLHDSYSLTKEELAKLSVKFLRTCAYELEGSGQFQLT